MNDHDHFGWLLRSPLNIMDARPGGYELSIICPEKRLKPAEPESYFWQTSVCNCWTGRCHALTSTVSWYICTYKLIHRSFFKLGNLFFASRHPEKIWSIASEQLEISTSAPKYPNKIDVSRRHIRDHRVGRNCTYSIYINLHVYIYIYK